MGTLRFFEEVVSFKIRRTFGFADYTSFGPFATRRDYFSAGRRWPEQSDKAGRKNTLDGGEEDFYGSPAAAAGLGGAERPVYLR